MFRAAGYKHRMLVLMDPLLQPLACDGSHEGYIKLQAIIPWRIMMANMVRYYNMNTYIVLIILGLIRYKIVIHAFIDGFARFITGIRASNNNRAATVFDLFLSLIENHGLPSRVRGDHGGENILVARFMEEQRGPDRGSYIWGR